MSPSCQRQPAQVTARIRPGHPNGRVDVLTDLEAATAARIRDPGKDLSRTEGKPAEREEPTMTATRHRTATALATILGVGVLGLAGAAPALAETPAPTVDVPAHLDWGTWTAKDGAPRYKIDGMGFTEGHVRVVVQNKAGKTIWTRTVQTTRDEGLPEPTFHVGTTVRCDHRVRYVKAQDLGSGEWTRRYTLSPCVL
jgi:hypothetical protein